MSSISLVIICAGIVHLSYSSHCVNQSLTLAENIHISISNKKINFHLKNVDNEAVLKGEFGALLSEYNKTSQVYIDDSSLLFGNTVQLKITRDEDCYNVNWTSSENVTLTDCFFYEQDNWYGGPENYHQYWPFNNMTFDDYSYVSKADENQAIVEPYWVTSSGFYIYVSKTTPLFIDSNHFYNNSLCLTARQAFPYLPRGQTTLAYKVCAFKNARVAHMKAVKTDLGHPTGIPDRRMIKNPIWSTWARLKVNINESAIMNFANQIIGYGFNNSQLEIDDNWETCYGSSEFNKSRFPNMPELGSKLKNMGFRVTLWNHPFVNSNCELFQQLEEIGYLVKNQHEQVNTSWWNGIGGIIDFTNPQAADWFVNERLAMLKTNNIDSIKMDAGESGWLPQIPYINSPIDDQPQAYTADYVRTIARFGGIVEVRTGHLTQNLPVFVRMIDKDSRWGLDNGLASVLTTLFQMNLNGYTFILPDMVGGNSYNSDKLTKELMIRWLQANTFMPSIQFSIAPWDFDNETVEICKKFTALHYEYSDRIISQMENCVRTGVPVNTPIWWVDPTDSTSQTIWSEYLLGEDLLVAPVVEEGATTRDIYLPKGKWRAEADPNHTVYEGRQWLRNYPAPLDTLPFFTRYHRD